MEKNTFSLIMVYSAFCTYFLNKHVSEIPLPGNDIQQVSIPQSSTKISDMAWPWCFPSHNVQVQMQHQLTVACSWAFLLKPRILEALLRFHHSTNHVAQPSPPANLGKKAIRAVLWPLGLCVLHYLVYSMLPHVWKDGKIERLNILSLVITACVLYLWETS